MAAMKKPGGLGKGLDALLGDFSAPAPAGVHEVDILLLDRNPDQPRKEFDPERLQELANSIERHGVVQPIVVQENNGRYTIVTGERRYRAARMAGLKTVPVVVRQYDARQVLEVSLIENIQREDLNPIEEAAAIQFLMEQHDLTQEEVAERLSKSRPVIANSLRLLSLPEKVREMLRDGVISAGHGRVLAGMGSEEKQIRLARETMEKHLSVRDLEKMAQSARSEAAEPKKPKEAPEPLSPELFDAQETLQERLGTKVKISGTPQQGRIVIEYFSEGDLTRIFDLLGE